MKSKQRHRFYDIGLILVALLGVLGRLRRLKSALAPLRAGPT